jgi:hypothetical protein
MAYTGAGARIEAWDYNRLTWGGNTTGTYTSTPSNLAYIWGVGNGAVGYGQDATAMTVVPVGGTVTATQWSTFVQRLNLALGHQSGAGARLASGSNIGIVAGATIQYFANVATAVGTVNTNATLFAAQGTTTTGTTNNWNPIGASGAPGGAPELSAFQDVNVGFASANAARHFFNAGGQLNVFISATSAANNQRSNNLRDLVNQLGGVTAFRNTTNGGRIGTGGTLATNNTSYGYRNLTFGVPTEILKTTSGSPYASDTASLTPFANTNDPGTNGGITSSIAFRFRIFSAADDVWNNNINLTVSTRCDIVFPSTTYLSGTAWGTPVVTFDNA